VFCGYFVAIQWSGMVAKWLETGPIVVAVWLETG